MDVKEVLLVVECKLLLLFFNQQGAVELQRCDSETERLIPCGEYSLHGSTPGHVSVQLTYCGDI